ncbi:MAG TPA: creatininase family protein [Chthoniobacteraceae bacterium]|jgi:creatinine amidohydrolase
MMPEWFSRLPSALDREPVLLDALAWPDVQQTLDDVLLLPIGATEQHGPHLPLNTDTVIATSACAYASARTGAPVLPALSFTVSLGHTEKWPGTFAIYHETLMSTVREIARWAVASGWKRLLLVNSHFGNDAAPRCAVDRLRFDFPGQLLIATRNTWQLPDLAREFTHDAADWHANDAETSLLLFLAPHTVCSERLATADDPDRTGDCLFPHMVAHTSTNGVTGTPTLATAERGATLITDIGTALAQLITRVRTEQPPLAWSRSTSAFAA